MKKKLKYQILGKIFLSIIFFILAIPVFVEVCDILMYLQHNKNIRISDDIFSYIIEFIICSLFIEINIYSYFKQIISHDEKLLINFNYINNLNETNKHTYKNKLIILFMIIIILIKLFESIYSVMLLKMNKNYSRFFINYYDLNYTINDIFSAFTYCIIAPFFEEYFFRVRYDRYFRFLKIGPWLLSNSIIFAFFHFNPIKFPFIFIDSYFILSLSYFLFRSYLFNVFLHSLLNFFALFFAYERFWILLKCFKNIDYKKIYIYLYSEFSLITVLCFVIIFIYLYVKIIKKYISELS
jgi:membrane protease YdiL (CAAX protease family)